MLAAAATDPGIAARVEFFSYRVPEEFYDYQEDPNALRNLIDDPAMQGRIEAFRARMLEFMQRTGGCSNSLPNRRPIIKSFSLLSI